MKEEKTFQDHRNIYIHIKKQFLLNLILVMLSLSIICLCGIAYDAWTKGYLTDHYNMCDEIGMPHTPNDKSTFCGHFYFLSKEGIKGSNDFEGNRYCFRNTTFIEPTNKYCDHNQCCSNRVPYTDIVYMPYWAIAWGCVWRFILIFGIGGLLAFVILKEVKWKDW